MIPIPGVTFDRIPPRTLSIPFPTKFTAPRPLSPRPLSPVKLASPRINTHILPPILPQPKSTLTIPKPIIPKPIIPKPIIPASTPSHVYRVPATIARPIVGQVREENINRNREKIEIPRPIVVEAPSKDVVLMEHQIEWANRAHGILMKHHGYIDTSRMRSGKTYVALWLAKIFVYPIVVVCPVTLVSEWRKTALKYGVTVLAIISYQSLRSTIGHQPTHGYLERHDTVTERGKRQVSFTATPEFNELVDKGILLIGDEIQNIKNNSVQYKAFSALIKPIISSGGSRFGLLSGTPFDKKVHAINLMRLIGYIRSYRLFTVDKKTNKLVFEGLQELINVCNTINPEETKRVVNMFPRNKKYIVQLAYVLYIDVIKTGISGAMDTPDNIIGTYDVKNGMYNIRERRNKELNIALDELARVTRFNQQTGTAIIGTSNLGAVNTLLVSIENAKAEDFARIATEILMASDNNKVIISVNYTSTIDAINAVLLMYNPLILNGQTPLNKRGAVITDFNTNPNRRVMIMNTAVGSCGISLYTNRPNSDRYMLISPSYKLLEITQAAARIYGPGMVSKAVVRIFYGGNTNMSERGILLALAEKTQVLKGTLEDIVNAKLKLPGEYETVTEDEDKEDQEHQEDEEEEDEENQDEDEEDEDDEDDE